VTWSEGIDNAVVDGEIDIHPEPLTGTAFRNSKGFFK
jgi:hypothetical protein